MKQRTDDEIINSLTAKNLELNMKYELSQKRLLEVMGIMQSKEKTLGKVRK